MLLAACTGQNRRNFSAEASHLQKVQLMFEDRYCYLTVAITDQRLNYPSDMRRRVHIGLYLSATLPLNTLYEDRNCMLAMGH